MKVLIVEDEKLSSDYLTLLINEIDPKIQILGCFDSVKKTKAFLVNKPEIDLLFLDIHLSDGNSFEIFENLELNVPVVFITAYDQYAIKAFKQNSVNYLLKPINRAELEFSIFKYKNMYEDSFDKSMIRELYLAVQGLNKEYKTRFLIKTGQSLNFIDIQQVQFFESDNGITFLISKTAQRFMLDFTLEWLESNLNPQEFFRINRKIIISIQCLEKVNPFFNNRLIISAPHLEGDNRIVSRERVVYFKRWLDDIVK